MTRDIGDEESGWFWAEKWRGKAHQLARLVWPLAGAAAVGWGLAIYLIVTSI